MTIWGYTHTRTHTLIPLIIKTIQAYIRCIFKIIFPIIYSGRIFFLFFNFCTPLDFIFWDFTPEIYDNTANTGSHNLHKKKLHWILPPPLFLAKEITLNGTGQYILYSVYAWTVFRVKMSEVTREWPDCFELTERLKYVKQNSLHLCRRASLKAQPWSRRAPAAEDHARCYSSTGYNSHALRRWETLPGLMIRVKLQTCLHS